MAVPFEGEADGGAQAIANEHPPDTGLLGGLGQVDWLTTKMAFECQHPAVQLDIAKLRALRRDVEACFQTIFMQPSTRLNGTQVQEGRSLVSRYTPDQLSDPRIRS
eukprot:6986704-Prymnesium_polylepis.1